MATLRIVEFKGSQETPDFMGFSTPLDLPFERLTEDMDREVVRAMVARRARTCRARLRRQRMGEERPRYA